MRTPLEPFAIARYGLGLVFLIFGIMQWIDPASWLGYLPSWASGSGTTLILLNGTLDLAIGVLLLLGVLTRITAVVAALHLLGVMATLGFNDVMVRDLGLLLVAIAIAVKGPDGWSLVKKPL